MFHWLGFPVHFKRLWRAKACFSEGDQSHCWPHLGLFCPFSHFLSLLLGFFRGKAAAGSWRSVSFWPFTDLAQADSAKKCEKATEKYYWQWNEWFKYFTNDRKYCGSQTWNAKLLPEGRCSGPHMLHQVLLGSSRYEACECSQWSIRGCFWVLQDICTRPSTHAACQR